MPQYLNGLPVPILSRYEIELEPHSILGRGGMGTVFKATDRLLHKPVAIKTINPGLVAHRKDSKSLAHRLFFREAMTHARLGVLHPELILPVRNYGIEDDTPFMEMDLVEGGSLRDRIDRILSATRKGPLFNEDATKQICKQICLALKVLHEHKAYHSDLKPENILFLHEAEFELRVSDLGIARIAESGFLTKAGVNTFFGGTRNYTPQAVVEGREKATERTDLYSLGVILFELLTRVPLQWSEARQDFVENHAALTPGAKDLVKRACQLMKRNNLKSADEFLEKLDEVQLLEA